MTSSAFIVTSAASLAAACLCGVRREVPPIAGLCDPDPSARGLRLVRHREAASGPLVLVNSFASGGSLFSVVLRINR